SGPRPTVKDIGEMRKSRFDPQFCADFRGIFHLVKNSKKNEKILLPQPYKSNCTDYSKMWHENGGKGPVTEKMCKEKCKLEKSIRLHGCAERRIDYPHNETICLDPIPKFAKNARYDCAERCSSPCNIRQYDVQVQEANSEGNRRSCSKSSDLTFQLQLLGQYLYIRCATIVHIIFENLEITTFTYTPRFEAIGILSFIGGYVGLWLGISLLNVYDFFEKWIFRLLACCKKRLTKKRKRVASSTRFSSKEKERRINTIESGRYTPAYMQNVMHE
ncbi:hypothetical protein JTE90_028056, partial [Oedothorax gibbosus]